MQRLEVSGALRPLQRSLGVKGLNLECSPSLLWSLWAFSVSVRKTCQAQWHFFSCSGWTALCSYTSRQKHQLLVHSKVLCVTVSKTGKMWYGHSLMGGRWHIQHLTQNLLFRSVWMSYCFRQTKDHHCLPEKLLPKMLISIRSVSLISLYIHSQLQTNTWDAFQSCDCITQNYVVFT